MKKRISFMLGLLCLTVMLIPQTRVEGNRESKTNKDTIGDIKPVGIFKKNHNDSLLKALQEYTNMLDSVNAMTSNSLLILKRQQKIIVKQTDTLKRQ